MPDKMTYAGTGVDYSAMDPYKIMAQFAGKETDHCIERLGFSVVAWTRGESVCLIETPWGYLGLVVEGLGTKNQIADAMYLLAKQMERLLMRRSYYDQAGQCDVAMAVNDLITLGALPIAYNQYCGLGASKWLNDKKRARELVAGTRNACLLARCAWTGGETPTLVGTIYPKTADLAGATMGIISPKNRLINPINIQDGDSIILMESSGLHANGATLARGIAAKESPWWNRILNKISPERFPLHGYLKKLSDGRYYGEALLDPTHIYVRAVEDCLDAGVDIHYAVNITGHGWRKLMRANQPFAYVIETLPTQLPIFDFILKYASDYEGYGNLNMGAGFALYVAKHHEEKALAILNRKPDGYPFRSFKGGRIEKSETKRVIIKPKGLEYSADSLTVR